MFSRCFGDIHMWGQIWPHKVWASLCQVLFFSNLLHSHGVWHFDIWQIISKSNPTPYEPACVILTLLDIFVIFQRLTCYSVLFQGLTYPFVLYCQRLKCFCTVSGAHMLFDWNVSVVDMLLLYCFKGWPCCFYCFRVNHVFVLFQVLTYRFVLFQGLECYFVLFQGFTCCLKYFRGSRVVCNVSGLIFRFVLFQGLIYWSVTLPWPRTCGWFYCTRAGWVRSLTPRTSSIRPRRKPGQITIFVWIRFSLEASVSENIRSFLPFKIWNILKHFSPFAQQCIPFVSF